MSVTSEDASSMTSGNGTLPMSETTPLQEADKVPMLKDLSSLMPFKAEMLHPGNPCLLAELNCWYTAAGFKSGRFDETVV
eukprot:CAMPEP_0172159854 /NCGR_PEP_ID=MMETSP1050-20130122/5220_1 /TAXON_ID=233186 /ORGANISM="Cryptomonas curvata, Strain CCAP979/52" /LENGTH=79 /DNA_ID=CAMNT_0012829525 /DNA_START=197 /DNA_END=436 /DNA_ORIENTATION=-